MLQFLHRIFVAVTVALALPAMAQSDPPARVGRLAFVENQVFFRVDRSDQGGPATVNWPVSSGAILETGQRGRAEIWIGSTAYRLADNSQAEFSAVDDARVDLRLNGGSLAVSILDRDQVDDVIVNTPDGDVRFLTPGRYRIDVFDDHSELSVQAGRAVFDDRGRATPVTAGQKASRWGNGSERLDADWDQDAFDQWVANRENATLASASRRYVSPHMTSYQDLDAYGDWQTAPDYGAVWYPRSVADDWAPYRNGRWAWVAPWGWTWIDQAPWGFAPFHYGRWAMIRGRWGWIPGSHQARPVYAPALVGWIGNPGWSVSFRSGAAPAVGWFPLAPREVYVPGHRYSHNYVRQINSGHVHETHLIDRAERGGPREPFRHNASPRAVTVVPANLMREGRPITAGEIRHHDRSELGRSPLARHAPNADWLAPTPGAARSHGEGRREQFDRPPRRDFEAPRQNPMERGAPRTESLPGNPNQPTIRQPASEAGYGRGAEPRREAWRGSPEMRQGAENRGRPVEIVPAAPTVVQPRRDAPPQEIRQPAPEAAQSQPNDGRRGFFRRSGEAPVAVPPTNSLADTAQAPMPHRDFNRRQGDPRFDGGAPSRPPEAAPAPAPMRREMPVPDVRSEERQARPMIQPQPVPQPQAQPPAPIRREVAAPEVRAEERQTRPQDREPRREMQDMQRMERPIPSPREREMPQIIRQPEAPRPAPEVRMPSPPPVREMPQQRIEQPRPPAQEFRAPAPAPAPMPQQRVEPPRPPVQEFRAPPPAPAPMPQPQQRIEPQRQVAPQGGAPNDPRRRHDDERGGR